jgi:uncharacterized membrane protein YoaK (UPF0700 family)
VIVRNRDRESLAKALHFFGIILIFAIGAGIGGVLSNRIGIRTIWVSSVLLLGVTLMMVKENEEKLNTATEKMKPEQ